MKLFVTGAAGFIGSHLCRRLLDRADTVVGFDNFNELLYGRALKDKNLGTLNDPGFRFIQGDVRDRDAVAHALDEAKPDAIVHLAALAGVRPSITHPALYAEVNISGTTTLVELALARKIHRFVFASSSSVYGRDGVVPFRESEPCTQPLSPYAASKRAAELVLQSLYEVSDLSATCLRFFTVYGPRQRPDLAIAKFTRLMADGQAIDLYGDGSTSRDYTWIDDIIDGVVASIDQQARDSRPHFRTFNLGGTQTTTLARLVELISAALGKTAKIVRHPEQPGEMKHTAADVSLAHGQLGFSPQMTIESGIARYVAWFNLDRQGSG